MILLDLFVGFLRVGCFAFGGAYGAIPLIRDVVLDYGWLSDETITYMIAVSESSPGPIMVNLATYVGSTQAGFPGAAVATFGVVLPAFLIILLIMALLKTALKNPYVQAAIRSMKPCMIGIILATGASMMIGNCVSVSLKNRIDGKALAMTLLLALLLFGAKKWGKKPLSSITFIGMAACLGMVIYGIG